MERAANKVLLRTVWWNHRSAARRRSRGQNPTPPTPDQSLAYAIPEADFIIHLDIATVVPAHYAMRKHAVSELDDERFVHDLVNRHKFFSLGFHTDGMSWRWDDSNRAGLDSSSPKAPSS